HPARRGSRPRRSRSRLCRPASTPMSPTGLAEIARYSVVDDVGRCINPLIVHGQTHGGVAQGVGEAMWEECVVDPASGQPLSGSFMDYGMPRSNSLPFFTTRIVEVLSPTNPKGSRSPIWSRTVPETQMPPGAANAS